MNDVEFVLQVFLWNQLQQKITAIFRNGDDEPGSSKLLLQNDLIGKECIVNGETERDVQHPRNYQSDACCVDGIMRVDVLDSLPLHICGQVDRFAKVKKSSKSILFPFPPPC